MNHNTRIKGKVTRRKNNDIINDPNQVLMSIAGYRDDIYAIFGDLDEFDLFWDEVKLALPRSVDLLDYLEQVTIIQTRPSFRELVNGYEALMNGIADPPRFRE